jgi:hypothetical protein
MAFRVTGEEQLDRVARTWWGMWRQKSITRRVGDVFRDEGDDITRRQREALAAGLPKRGGAAATVSSEARLTVRPALSSGTSTAVDIVDSWPGHNMETINDGSLWHPLYGNRRHMVQHIRSAGMLTKPVLAGRRPIAALSAGRLTCWLKRLLGRPDEVHDQR